MRKIKKQLFTNIASEILENMNHEHQSDMPDGMETWMHEHMPMAWDSTGASGAGPRIRSIGLRNALGKDIITHLTRRGVGRLHLLCEHP